MLTRLQVSWVVLLILVKSQLILAGPCQLAGWLEVGVPVKISFTRLAVGWLEAGMVHRTEPCASLPPASLGLLAWQGSKKASGIADA